MWIEVFKGGTHTDSAGNKREWTANDLKTIVSKYNDQSEEDKHEAPVVIGHPETDSPAYGWVEQLKVEGEKILAKVKDLTPEFVEWVKKGLYKKRSISLYPNLLLKHVGFLGGVPPAVKGLADPAFNTDAEYITYEFADAAYITYEFAEIDAIEEAKTKLKEREKLYGIGIKDKIGYISKPTAYEGIGDDLFADPVNYLYPIDTKPNWIASLRTFDAWEYNKIEQQIIYRRLYESATKLGVSLREEQYFNENKIALNRFAEIDRVVLVEQQQRSARYGIEVKDKGNLVKPKHYKDNEDDDFADPVHYRLPIAKKFIVATLANWSKQKIKDQYTEQERQIIDNRIKEAISKHSIKTKQNYNQKLKEKNFMDNEKFTSLVADLIAWTLETFGEETANQLNGYLEENKAKWVTTTAAPAAPAASAEPKADGMSHSEKESQKKMLEMALEIENLKKENRKNDFKNYVEKLMKDDGKLLPKQYDLAMATLELGHKSGKAQFSEAGQVKEVEGVQLIKQFMESFEKKIDVAPIQNTKPSEDFDANGHAVNEERLALDKKIKDYISEQAKNGVSVTYSDSLTKVINL
jgi:hypothetical protein